jgi:hypothetical protein
MLAVALALASTLAAGPPAPPPDDAALRAQVNDLLGAIDRPVSAESWRALGPDAVPILSGIASAPDVRPSKRASAVAALAILGGPEAERVHRALARDPAAPWNVRMYAVRGMPRVVASGRVATEVRPVLAADADARVRAAAAEVLVRDAPGGCAVVRDHLAREPARSRALVAHALSRCR